MKNKGVLSKQTFRVRLYKTVLNIRNGLSYFTTECVFHLTPTSLKTALPYSKLSLKEVIGEVVFVAF